MFITHPRPRAVSELDPGGGAVPTPADADRTAAAPFPPTSPSTSPPPAEAVGGASRSWAGESGQATAEYALVLLGAAAVALLLVAWAASSGLIGELFDTVVRQLISRVG